MSRAIPIYFLVNSIDPTKTLTIRQRFVAEMRRRYLLLWKDIKEAIVDLDCFGLASPRSQVLAADISQGQFNFPLNDEKINAFIQWLSQKNAQYLLSSGSSGLRTIGDIAKGTTDARRSWMNLYIDSAYQRGIRRGRQELRKLGINVEEGDLLGESSILTAFNRPIHADRVGLAYTRAYSSLKGITSEMESAVSDVLAMGLADGKNPRELARLVDRTVRGTGKSMAITDSLGRRIPSQRRSEILARTEVVRSHHAANMAEYRQAGIMGIQIQAEHLTAGDKRVCDECAPLNGKRYDLDEAEYIIPVHPQCRCVALPYIPDDTADIEIPIGETAPILPATATLPKDRPEKYPMNFEGGYQECLFPGSFNSIGIFLRLPECDNYTREGSVWKYKGEEITDADELKRLKAMRIPPAWSNVVVSKDITAKIQAVGLDKAGRWQYRYSAEHTEKAAKKKFDRVKSFTRDFPAISKKIDDGIAQGDPRAYLLAIERQTGIRVGSDTDFKAKKKAYGLTTLLNRHVEVEGSKIRLNFIAKEGIPASYELDDITLANWLSERKALGNLDDKMFPDVSASKLNAYLKELADGKKYTVKDFRTYLGTFIAREELKQYAGSTNLSVADRKKIVKEVCEKVSSVLKNTPSMARKSYIDPMVWEYIGGLP